MREQVAIFTKAIRAQGLIVFTRRSDAGSSCRENEVGSASSTTIVRKHQPKTDKAQFASMGYVDTASQERKMMALEIALQHMKDDLVEFMARVTHDIHSVLDPVVKMKRGNPECLRAFFRWAEAVAAAGKGKGWRAIGFQLCVVFGVNQLAITA